MKKEVVHNAAIYGASSKLNNDLLRRSSKQLETIGSLRNLSMRQESLRVKACFRF